MRRARASGPTCARASAKRKRTRRPVHNGTIRGDQPLRQHEPSTDVGARWPLPAVWRRCERADSRSAVQRDPARRGATAAERILCRLRCAADRQPLRGTAPHDPRTVGLRTHDGRGSIERPRAACGALGFTLRPSRVREETPFRPGTPVPRVAPPVDAQGIPCDWWDTSLAQRTSHECSLRLDCRSTRPVRDEGTAPAYHGAATGALPSQRQQRPVAELQEGTGP